MIAHPRAIRCVSTWIKGEKKSSLLGETKTPHMIKEGCLFDLNIWSTAISIYRNVLL